MSQNFLTDLLAHLGAPKPFCLPLVLGLNVYVEYEYIPLSSDV